MLPVVLSSSLIYDTVELPNPLDESKSWLVLERPGGGPVHDLAGVNPETPQVGAGWQVIGEVPLYISGPLFHVIGVRIAPVTGSNPPITANSPLKYVVAFGAPLPKASLRASPFKNKAPGAFGILTTFTGVINPYDDPAINPKAGWFFRLSSIDHDSGNRRTVNRYEFALGAIITVGGIEYHFGMDPEMDVGF